MDFEQDIKLIESTLARLDERAKIQETILQDIKRKLESQYVTQEEFKPVRTIIYGLIGLITSTVVVALVSLAMQGTHPSGL